MNKSTLPYNPHKSFILAKDSKLSKVVKLKLKKNKTKRKKKQKQRIGSLIKICCTYTTSF